jgi:hypothetical protein
MKLNIRFTFIVILTFCGIAYLLDFYRKPLEVPKTEPLFKPISDKPVDCDIVYPKSSEVVAAPIPSPPLSTASPNIVDPDLAECGQFLDSIINESDMPSSLKNPLTALLDLSVLLGPDKVFSYYHPLLVKTKEEIEQKLKKSHCYDPSPSNRVALLVITNGVVPNIQEWIVTYLLNGIIKIIIFDDSKSGTFLQTRFHAALQPFVDGNYVEIKPVHHLNNYPTWNEKQMQLYDSFITSSRRKEYHWLGLVDTDEYLIPRTDQCFPKYLSNYTEFEGLGIAWKFFPPINIFRHNISLTHFEQFKIWEDRIGYMKLFLKTANLAGGGIHHGTFSKPNATVVDYKKKEYQNRGDNESEMDNAFELRHYYMGDLSFSMLDKICGAGRQRTQYRTSRAAMLLNIFKYDTKPYESRYDFDNEVRYFLYEKPE